MFNRKRKNREEKCGCYDRNIEVAKEMFSTDKYCAVIHSFDEGDCAILGHGAEKEEIITFLEKSIEKLKES